MMPASVFPSQSHGFSNFHNPSSNDVKAFPEISLFLSCSYGLSLKPTGDAIGGVFIRERDALAFT